MSLKLGPYCQNEVLTLTNHLFILFRTEFHLKATQYQSWQAEHECAFSDRGNQYKLFELVKPWVLWFGKPTSVRCELLMKHWFSLSSLLIDGRYSGFSLNESVPWSYKRLLKGVRYFMCPKPSLRVPLAHLSLPSTLVSQKSVLPWQ